jgi:hypothetical protein
MVGAAHDGIVRGDMNGLENNGHGQAAAAKQPLQREDGEESKWYEEEIHDDLKLCYALNRLKLICIHGVRIYIA